MGTQFENELISVIMGVYYQKESTDLLERAVRSVLNQSCRDFEFLICDDGSNQKARTAIDQLAVEDSRIKLIRGVQKTDLASKLNACLCRAKGYYIARMDDDDWSAPERFEKQVQALNKDRECSFVGSNVLLCKDGKVYGVRVLPEHPAVKDFYMTQPFVHPTLMFRREDLVSVGGYSEKEHQVLCEDYDLLLRLYAEGYYGINLQEELLTYTVSATAKTTRRMRHRWNEAVTRFCRFHELKVLPRAFPYVVKPLVVGLLPEGIMKRCKEVWRKP